MFRDRLFDSARSLRGDYEAVDWARTPLGAPSTWSLALRNTVDLALNTDFAVTLLWGPEFVLVYNEAYTELIADKHPYALGRTAEEIFPEAWHEIGPMMNGVYAGNGPVNNVDLYLPLLRRGRLEEGYFDFSYSPVRGADGLIEGVIDITAETTGRVIAVRRMETLTGLRELAATVDSAAELRERALALLRRAERDFPAVELQPEGTALPRPPRAPDELAIGSTDAGRMAWVPLADGVDVLAVRLSEHLAEDDAQVEFLELIGHTLGQALVRIGERETERDVALAERRMSETLQQSMLTRPVGLEDARVATRYQTAAVQAHVGGDWYDAFRLPDGALALVIGDVTGHDRNAAAAMAQVKSMLRALAVSIGKPPADVLQALDEAMVTLELDVYASGVFARLVSDDEGLRLEWSNAGHPPPVLVEPDGTATLLERKADLMLGVGVFERADHVVRVPPGSSVVFYTDGLVERRRRVLDDGFDALLATIGDLQQLDAESLADVLLQRMASDAEDDIALLVLSTPAR